MNYYRMVLMRLATEIVSKKVVSLIVSRKSPIEWATIDIRNPDVRNDSQLYNCVLPRKLGLCGNRRWKGENSDSSHGRTDVGTQRKMIILLVVNSSLLYGQE